MLVTVAIWVVFAPWSAVVVTVVVGAAELKKDTVVLPSGCVVVVPMGIWVVMAPWSALLVTGAIWVVLAP